METGTTHFHATDTDHSESDLIHGLQRGDEWAYAALCRRYGPLLHNFATFQLAGDSELAEDVVLQAFVDAARNIRHFSPRSASLKTWLYGIVRRKVVAERRKQQRRKSVPKAAVVPLDEAAGVVDDTAGAVVERLAARQKLLALAAMLSDIEMEVLTLFYSDQLTIKEIAQVIGRSEQGGNSLLHRARQKAREKLEKDHE